MTARNYVRFAFGGASLVAFIFAMVALNLREWALGSVDGGILGEATVTFGLWRINRDYENFNDDDRAMKRNQLDSRKTWQSVEFNRAASTLAVIYTLFVMIWYFSTAGCFISGVADMVLGSIALVLAIFAWAGAGSWGETFDEKELDGDVWDDTTPCAAGCGMEAFNGVYYLGLGLAFIAAGAAERRAPGGTRDRAPAADAGPPVVGAVVVEIPAAAAKPNSAEANA